MNVDSWTKLIASQGFWSGVIASILAAAIVGITVYIFKNSIYTVRHMQERGRKENELFESALNLSSPYAPFAFGVVQARALRYFLIAVFVAYIGDIMGLLYPFNLFFYLVSLYFIFVGLKWFFKIEHRGMQILNLGRSKRDI